MTTEEFKTKVQNLALESELSDSDISLVLNFLGQVYKVIGSKHLMTNNLGKNEVLSVN